MKILLKKLKGMWYMIIGEAEIRTPYSDQSPRADVSAYALRAFPGAEVYEA